MMIHALFPVALCLYISASVFATLPDACDYDIDALLKQGVIIFYQKKKLLDTF